MPNRDEILAWLEANPPKPVENVILSYPDRFVISHGGSADFVLQDKMLEIVIDGEGMVDVTTDGDLLFGLTEDSASQGETIDLDLLPGTPIVLQGGSGTLTMTSHS